MCISLLCFTDYVIFSFVGHGLEVTVLQVTGWKFRLLQVNLSGRYLCLFAVYSRESVGFVSFYTAGHSCIMSLYVLCFCCNSELDSRMY